MVMVGNMFMGGAMTMAGDAAVTVEGSKANFGSDVMLMENATLMAFNGSSFSIGGSISHL